MTGYIQRLLDRSASLALAGADIAIPNVKAVGRLKAPLIEHDQRLATGNESLSDIEGFLDRENFDIPPRHELFDKPRKRDSQLSRPRDVGTKPEMSPTHERPIAKTEQTIIAPPEIPASNAGSIPALREDIRSEDSVDAFLPEVPSPIERILERSNLTENSPASSKNNKETGVNPVVEYTDAVAEPNRSQDIFPENPSDEFAPEDAGRVNERLDKEDKISRLVAEPSQVKLKVTENQIITETVKDESKSFDIPDHPKPVIAEPSLKPIKADTSYQEDDMGETPSRYLMSSQSLNPAQIQPAQHSEEQEETPPRQTEQRFSHRSAESMSVIGPIPVRRRTRTIRGLRRR